MSSSKRRSNPPKSLKVIKPQAPVQDLSLLPEIPIDTKDSDSRFDLKQHEEEFAHVMSGLSPTTKNLLLGRGEIARNQSVNHPISNPQGYFDTYEDTMGWIEATNYTDYTIPTKSSVEAITAICLCHGNINSIVKININPSTYRVVERLKPIVTKRHATSSKKKIIPERDIVICNVNYDGKFEFEYATIPYCGSFTNVGSCPGLPTAEPPNPFFNEQNIVRYEYDLLACNETSSPEKCQPYMLSLSLNPMISRKLKEGFPLDEDSSHLFLPLHDNYPCRSLLNKLYETKHSELLTEDISLTRGDKGKFILLTKVKNKYGDIEKTEIIKTVILGSTNYQDELNFLGMKTKKDLSGFMSIVNENTKEVRGEFDTYYATTTQEIVALINQIKGRRSIPVKFFDSSCNMIINLDYENPTPSVLLELQKINEYFLTQTRSGHSVHGGTRKLKKSTRKR